MNRVDDPTGTRQAPVAGTVATVCGPVPPENLGVTNAHDHLFLTSAALPGIELEDEGAALAEAKAFTAAGGSCLVQWSPAGTGRRLDALERISVAAGVHVVAATGRHLAAHYQPSSPVRSMGVDGLANLFVEDLNRRGCGLIKVGTEYWGPGEFDRMSLEAAANAAGSTGVPIAVHLERGTAALEVLDALERHGHPASRVILGHLGRFPDRTYITQVLQRGCYACFDAPSMNNHATDWRTPSLIAELCSDGYADLLMVGADTTNAKAQPASGGAPGTSNLLRWTASHLQPLLGIRNMHKMLVENPARALTNTRT